MIRLSHVALCYNLSYNYQIADLGVSPYWRAFAIPCPSSRRRKVDSMPHPWLEKEGWENEVSSDTFQARRHSVLWRLSPSSCWVGGFCSSARSHGAVWLCLCSSRACEAKKKRCCVMMLQWLYSKWFDSFGMYIPYYVLLPDTIRYRFLPYMGGTVHTRIGIGSKINRTINFWDLQPRIHLSQLAFFLKTILHTNKTLEDEPASSDKQKHRGKIKKTKWNSYPSCSHQLHKLLPLLSKACIVILA